VRLGLGDGKGEILGRVEYGALARDGWFRRGLGKEIRGGKVIFLVPIEVREGVTLGPGMRVNPFYLLFRGLRCFFSILKKLLAPSFLGTDFRY